MPAEVKLFGKIEDPRSNIFASMENLQWSGHNFELSLELEGNLH